MKSNEFVLNLLIGFTTMVASTASIFVSAAPSVCKQYEAPDHKVFIERIRRTGVNAPVPPMKYDPTAIYDPNGARSLKVMGIFMSSKKAQILVQVRGSEAIQVLEVGSTINDGQTRIKKIENLDTGEPIVIFEEDGVEIKRRVREG